MSATGKLIGPDSGQFRMHPGVVAQSCQSGWSTYYTSAGRKRRQRRLRKWRRRVARRRRRRQARATAKEASLKHMSGVPNQALESMSAMALTPIMSTIGVPSQAFESKPAMALTSMVSHQEEEASANPNAASVDHLRVAQPDHLLLVIKAMVNGMAVNALVDSGATRSFISDQMKTRPPLAFIGAYSSLELANGECVISTGIAPNVLISIRGAQSRISLTAVPMMEVV